MIKRYSVIRCIETASGVSNANFYGNLPGTNAKQLQFQDTIRGGLIKENGLTKGLNYLEEHNEKVISVVFLGSEEGKRQTYEVFTRTGS